MTRLALGKRSTLGATAFCAILGASNFASAADPTAASPPSSEPAQESQPASAEPAGQDSADECLAHHREAQAELRALHLLAAGTALRECLAPRCSPVLREDCGRLLSEVDRDVPSVVLVAESPSGDLAEVEVYDGAQLVASSLDGAALQLDPGEHQFTFKAAGWISASRSIVLRVGEHQRRVAVQLIPEPAPSAPITQPAPTRVTRQPGYAPNRALTYTLLGGGAAAGISGLWLGLSARRAYYDAKRDCAPLCDPSLKDDIRRRSLVADGLFVLSGAALVWGGVRLLTLHRQGTTTSVLLGPSEITARGQF